jgi:hypothetical protein
MAWSEKAPKVVALAMSSFPRWVDGVELTRMDIIWETKYLAIGIAAAAAFVIASHALNYNWL